MLELYQNFIILKKYLVFIKKKILEIIIKSLENHETSTNYFIIFLNIVKLKIVCSTKVKKNIFYQINLIHNQSIL